MVPLTLKRYQLVDTYIVLVSSRLATQGDCFPLTYLHLTALHEYVDLTYGPPEIGGCNLKSRRNDVRFSRVRLDWQPREGRFFRASSGLRRRDRNRNVYNQAVNSRKTRANQPARHLDRQTIEKAPYEWDADEKKEEGGRDETASA